MTWANVYPDLCHHVTSLGHNPLSIHFFFKISGYGKKFPLFSNNNITTCNTKSCWQTIHHIHFTFQVWIMNIKSSVEIILTWWYFCNWRHVTTFCQNFWLADSFAWNFLSGSDWPTAVMHNFFYHSFWLAGSMSSAQREIKFIDLFGDRGHRGPYSPYKPCNHNPYIGIIIFPHTDNPQSTGYN